MIAHCRPYPLTHNLTLLRDLCSAIDPSLLDAVAPALVLTDFAVRFRYLGHMPEELLVEDARQWIRSGRNVYLAITERLQHPPSLDLLV